MWSSFVAFVAIVAIVVGLVRPDLAFKVAYYLYNTRIGYFVHVHFVLDEKPAHNARRTVSDLCDGAFRVVTVPILSDNFSFLIIDNATNQAALVDPADPKTTMAMVQHYDVELKYVLTTHKHWDHSGGNSEIKRRCGDRVRIVGGRHETVPSVDKVVEEGDVIHLGTNTNIHVWDTPGHTRGHVMYLVSGIGGGGGGGGNASSSSSSSSSTTSSKDSIDSDGDDVIRNYHHCHHALFTGDMLFSGGCGKFFECDAVTMYATLHTRLQALTANDTVLFVGHEYTQSNLEFAEWIEPSNQAIQQRLAYVNGECRVQRMSTIPLTLQEERLINPFLRVNDLQQDITSPLHAHSVRTMAGPQVLQLIRDLKNTNAHINK